MPSVGASWTKAVACDAAGDLVFAAASLAELRTDVDLPDLSCLGWTRAKRASCYRPDPNGWGRMVTEYETRPAIRLLVPRRYQWWLRLVARVRPIDVVLARVVT